MKTIPVEQLDERLAKALDQQDEHEAIGLTVGAGTVAWILRVPHAMQDAGVDAVAYAEGPANQVVVIRLQVKHGRQTDSSSATPHPEFGAGRGTLTIVSEDDEHLKDFQEYME